MNLRRFISKHILGRDDKKATRGNQRFVLRQFAPVFDLSMSAEVISAMRFSRLVKPVVADDAGAGRILVIAPHPDDDLFGAGGTLMKSVARGAEVRVVYIATEFPDKDRSKRIRAEASAVCKAMGTSPVFMGYPKGGIPADNAARQRLLDEVLGFAPDTLMISFLLDDHDDHRRVNQLLFPELSRRMPALEVWAYQVYSTVLPNMIVDVSSVMEEKKRLIRSMPSVFGKRDWAHYVSGMNAICCRFMPAAGECYGEPFLVMPAQEYAGLCETYFGNAPAKVYDNQAYK